MMMPTLALTFRIPIRRPVRANLAAGFTLLELLLVLTIIGMAAILVVPNVGNMDARSFSAQTRQASSLLNYARRLAVVRGQPSTASFYPASDDDREPVLPQRNSVGSWQSNGADIRFRDSTDRESAVEDLVEITFYPEGGSTGGTLLLVLGAQQVSINIDPFTGRVETEYAEE
jgi:general secretion pathway protein H